MRARSWFVTIAIVTLVAGACTSNGNNGNNSSGHVTLTLWNIEEGSGGGEFFDALVKGFEKKYPNVSIDVTSYPEAQYGTKVATAIAAGSPPDLGDVYSFELMKEGKLVPLDDMIKQQGIDLSTYNKAIVGDPSQENAEFGCSYGGKLYCMGSYTGAVMLFYNKDMFDAAGIPYPKAWPPMTTDEFVKIACELTNPDQGVYGAAYGDPVTWNPWEMVVSPDGRTATGYVNGPTSVHVHDILAQGIRNKCAPSLNVLDPWEQGNDFFSRGKLAMVVTDFQSLFKIENAGINYGITAPPTPAGLQPFFNVWTDSTGIFEGTDHQKEAEEFIAYLTTEGQHLRVSTTGDLPLDSKVAKSDNWANGIPGREEALQVMPHARAAVFIPNRWDTYGPIFDAFGPIISGEKTAQQALDEAAPAIQQNLDKQWKIWEGQ
jgi:ABC-type glycerol-3-phosphate transport system substrate-binding protein